MVPRADAEDTDLDGMIKKHRMGALVVEAAPGSVVHVGHEFWFGAAIRASAFGGREATMAQEEYRRVFLENFNVAVTENALKWHQMEPEMGQVDFSVVDYRLEWTAAHEISLRGHNLFWGVRDWVQGLDDHALRRNVAWRAKTIAVRYKGEFAEYDLNNEMMHEDFYAARLGKDITRDMVD